MQFEIEIIKWFQGIGNVVFDILVEGITFLGEQYVIIVILAFIYFVYNKKIGEAIAYTLFLSLSLNNAVKGVIGAKRPFEVDNTIVPKRPQTATGFSFPSGHTQGSTTLYTSIGLVLKNRKVWIGVICLVFLIGASRLYLGVHFPRDVIVGWALGITCSFLGSYLYNKFATSLKAKMLLFITTAVIFIPFNFIFYRSNFSDIEKYRDFFTGYALFWGFILATFIENKYVNFDCSNTLKIRLIRYFIGLLLFVIIQFGLKLLFPDENIFFDMLRYFLVTFVPMGLYPLTFKKFKLI